MQTHPQRLVRAIDYLVVTRDDNDGRTPAGHNGLVELAHGVRIERLDPALAERLFAATDLRGENWSCGRLYVAVHAYVREAWTEGEATAALDTWDHEHRIWSTVQLSRLVRDNGTSTEHAAQLQIHADGSDESSRSTDSRATPSTGCTPNGRDGSTSGRRSSCARCSMPTGASRYCQIE